MSTLDTVLAYILVSLVALSIVFLIVTFGVAYLRHGVC